MGNFESSMSSIMDRDNESDSQDEDMEISYDMFHYMNVDNDDNRTDEDYYINLLLQRFIHTGELTFDDASVNPRRLRMPQIKVKPNLENLQKNSIFQSIKHRSGYGTDETSPTAKWSLVNMINNRQTGTGPKPGSFSQSERCKINNNFLPNYKKTLKEFDRKLFCGTFSRDGNYFLTASQDSVIRLYDATTNKYKSINEVSAKDVNWCILDIAFSPDGEYFVYSTWSSCLYISRIHDSAHNLQPLFLHPAKSSFCIFSLAFSNCGEQIIGGGSDGCLYIYDRLSDRRTLKIPVEAENHDVNAVGFVDDTSNILYSGSDSGVLKIWDRRSLNESNPKEVGVLIGHLDGITYIDSKNDTRYLISNSKDQTIKLWDMRVFSNKSDENLAPSFRRQIRYHSRWDYRWDEVPKEFYTDSITLPEDVSVMTYRGHRVCKTLIRAKFSPLETTGQRYIYTGCGTGRLIIYDVLTGNIVSSIRGHNDIVRDVAWHPYRNEILTSSWDFHLNLNTYYCPKKVPFKRYIKETEPNTNGEGSSSSSAPPPRRSRRIALRKNASNQSQ